MDEATTANVTANDVDLSGYTVTIKRGAFGWSWAAVAPDGEEVPGFPPGIDLRLYGQRTVAEARALKSIEAHALDRPDVSMDGDELRRRVRDS